MKYLTAAVDGSKVLNHSSNVGDPDDFGAATDNVTPILQSVE